MSHNHGGMSMGPMSLPDLPEFPKFYYAVVGSTVGIATIVNIYNHILYRQRLSAARAGAIWPAKPKAIFPLWNATLFALAREASNFSVRIPFKGRFVRLPPVGRTLLVLANVAVLLVLCFYGLNLTSQFSKENVGFRCGAVTIGQLPLIFLLSGKNNVIGFLTGISYERLNWLHRWTARCMLLTATIHMGYFLSVWAPYDYFGVQLKQNKLVWRGLAAWNPPISWTPGQHVFLSCQGVAPLQNHPFTIASIPEDGKMEFVVKAHSGADAPARLKTVTIEGPYGCHRPLRQFDSVVLLAGSTGATFTIPLLRDVLQGWRENTHLSATPSSSFFASPKGAVTRHVRFVWVVKSRGQLEMFSEALSSAYADFQILQEQMRDIKLQITVYVTCDESFTEEHKSLLSTMTAPKSTKALNKAVEHGSVELRNRSIGEKEKNSVIQDEVKEITITSSSGSDEATGACGTDNTCCCRAPVDEESTTDPTPCCCCTPANGPSSPSRSSVSSTQIPRKQKLLVHPSVQIYSGRPQTKDIIRRSLEQALGESAVVVCGPSGLIGDVKQDVVELSDERAVHKGTGAQGVYLHTEGFGW
ncbi:hypothetical protein E8E13_010629 [Curvularia kusanoi]|uniref:ferric-chelate reductase (NADPH) n=1 Tax=Curvularia kusanoi TaxID=90978 RepID=A0A9P4TME8_CURKU|nr:hypothetical protein E8E13_010629 [Curvularia kusanoi]